MFDIFQRRTNDYKLTLNDLTAIVCIEKSVLLYFDNESQAKKYEPLMQNSAQFSSCKAINSCRKMVADVYEKGMFTFYI